MPDPLIGAVHKQNALSLDAALKAAPTLKYHPDLAYHAATMPGNISENAQHLAGLRLLQKIVEAVDAHAKSNPNFSKLANALLEAASMQEGNQQ